MDRTWHLNNDTLNGLPLPLTSTGVCWSKRFHSDFQSLRFNNLRNRFFSSGVSMWTCSNYWPFAPLISPIETQQQNKKTTKTPPACLCHKHPVISKAQPKPKTGSSPISDRLNSRFIIAVMKPQGGRLTRRDSAQLHLAHCESPKVWLPLLPWALLLPSNSNAPLGN